MSLEHTLTRFEPAVFPSLDAPAHVAARPHTWWPLIQIALAALFATYVVEAVQDFQRIRELQAEPSRLGKIVVITKNEAWQRIHSRAARSHGWQVAAHLGLGGTAQP